MVFRQSRLFFEQDIVTVAKELLGDYFICWTERGRIIGKIVETEAYGDTADLASHARFGNKGRSQIMFGSAGILYVYAIYGLFDLTNIICGQKGSPAAVLIRAAEIIEGKELAHENLQRHRYMKKYYADNGRSFRPSVPNNKLASGPGKFSVVFGIDRNMNGTDITLCDKIFIDSPKDKPAFDIIETTRVGIDYAGISKDWSWRFYIKDNPYVSKK